MKKDAYYFPHFCNARGDRKIKRLTKDLGVEGYGLYFMLLEVLREQEGFRFPLADVDLLADEFRTSEAKLKTVLSNYSLFEIDDKEMFFSPKFDEYMEPYLKMKNQRIEAAKKSVESRRKKLALTQTTVERPLNDRKTNVERPLKRPLNDRKTTVETTVEQSKVKKRKVKKSKEDNPLTFFFRNFDNSLSAIDKEYFSHNYQEVIYTVKTIHGVSSDDVNNYIQSFFLNKASYEFENENHVKSAFRKFVEIEREKNLDISKNEYKPRKLKRLEE